MADKTKKNVLELNLQFMSCGFCGTGYENEALVVMDGRFFLLAMHKIEGYEDKGVGLMKLNWCCF